VPSPLAAVPRDTYILGYFQNNPDGSFQTPLVGHANVMEDERGERVRQLESVNTIFNRRKLLARLPTEVPEDLRKPTVTAKKAQPSFADRFLIPSEGRRAKTVLGQQRARKEEITADQAMNMAQRESGTELPEKGRIGIDAEADRAPLMAYRTAEGPPAAPAPGTPQSPTARTSTAKPDADRYVVEVAPLQAVAIDADQVFIFRRIGITGEIYRQGFVIRLQPFLDHLVAVFYETQPIAGYTRLTLNAAGRTTVRGPSESVVGDQKADWVAGRMFPAPFGFLSADMHAVSLPRSPARQTLTLALAMLGVVMVAGLVAIYHSARAVLDLSERRSRFVSAVTHELKTPLTNIRMYIEMLDQGIAATPEHEQAYVSILSSESARLSGLIDNVLELSRLEKQTRRFELKTGNLSDVFEDLQSIMAEHLAREGFQLKVVANELPEFAYDREVLVQVLINLMENSIKFGRHLPRKEIAVSAGAVGGWATLTVADTGPGIPRRALKHVFDDFYRVDNDLSHTSGGTGIGLALVKKFIQALGGKVDATNNDGPGCTIRIRLPLKRPS
jgi:signal transduction histidine kinase